MREFQEAYPTPPCTRLRRVLVRDGLWVAEGVIDYGGGRVSNIAVILELKDGKIWRDTRYSTPSRSKRRSSELSGSSGWKLRGF